MMNPKAQHIHAENRERMLREREVMRARFVGAIVKPVVKRVPYAGAIATRFSAGVAEIERPKLRERNCLRCERPFRSEGPANRMCPDCARLPEGFGL